MRHGVVVGEGLTCVGVQINLPPLALGVASIIGSTDADPERTIFSVFIGEVITSAGGWGGEE